LSRCWHQGRRSFSRSRAGGRVGFNSAAHLQVCTAGRQFRAAMGPVSAGGSPSTASCNRQLCLSHVLPRMPGGRNAGCIAAAELSRLIAASQVSSGCGADCRGCQQWVCPM